MIEVTTPQIAPEAATGNLTRVVTTRATNTPDRIVISRPMGAGWHGVSAKEFDEEIRSVAKGLIAQGVNAGDRVAIMAKTRYEWTVLDFAIWYAGAICVPIYETSSAEQVKWILEDSGAALLIVETPLLAELAQPVLPNTCKAVLIITNNALPDLQNSGAYI